MQSDQLLLDELLVTLGGQAEGDGAETSAVVRTGNNAVSFMLSSLHILQISIKFFKYHSHADFRSDQLLELRLVVHVDNKHPVT